mgnify:CR=1 FL=1
MVATAIAAGSDAEVKSNSSFYKRGMINSSLLGLT